MARAAAKGGKRPRQDARVRKPAEKRSGRKQLSQTEQSLLFTRIRRQAKWAFVALVVVFGVSYAVAGVGSGNGVNPFQDIFKGGGGGGSSISSLEKQVAKHPKNATAWQQLSLAYSSKSRTQDAVDAMTHYTSLRPKSADGWQQLGQLQANQARQIAYEWQQAQFVANAWQSGAASPLTVTGKLSTALGTDPAQQALAAQASQAQQEATSIQTTALDAYAAAVKSLQKVATLHPNDAGAWTTVMATSVGGMSALGVVPGLATPALVAYDRVKKLDPAGAKQYAQTMSAVKKALAASHG